MFWLDDCVWVMVLEIDFDLMIVVGLFDLVWVICVDECFEVLLLLEGVDFIWDVDEVNW